MRSKIGYAEPGMGVLEELPCDIIGGRELLAVFEHEKE